MNSTERMDSKSVDEQIATTELAIKHLGYYRVLFTSAVQFNSIIFRLTVGLLSDITESALALETAVEFVLNAIFEIPGGMLADKIGRAKCSLIGILGVAVGLVLMFFAIILSSSHPILSAGFVVFDGLVLGFSKPLFSGAVEGYYQSIIEHGELDHPEIKKIVSESFIRSGRHGKMIPSVALVLSFFTAYGLQKIHMIHYALLIGTVPYGVVCYWLIKDYKKFGDPSQHRKEFKHEVSAKEIFKTLFGNPKLKLATILQFFYFIIYAPLMGYGVVAIGRRLSSADTPWGVLLAFMAGNLTFGWYLKGTLLPHMIATRKNHFTIMIWCSLFSLASFAISMTASSFSTCTWMLSMFFYMTVFQVATSAISSISTNLTLKSIPKTIYATTLSLQNMPSYLAFGLYSFYLMKFGSGAPRINELFLTEAILTLSLISIIVLFKTTKNVTLN